MKRTIDMEEFIKRQIRVAEAKKRIAEYDRRECAQATLKPLASAREPRKFDGREQSLLLLPANSS